jgi:glutathione S-transferase
MTPNRPLKLYRHPLSGHSHRVQLALSLMGLPHKLISAAPEGNVDLGAYPKVRAWLARIEALPGFVAFQKTPVGLAA